MKITKKELEHVLYCRGIVPEVHRKKDLPLYNLDGTLLGYKMNEEFAWIQCKLCRKLKERYENT